ncbi:hypothetical protein IWX47DRAFT_227417 [Phyllosticta citricarpa]
MLTCGCQPPNQTDRSEPPTTFTHLFLIILALVQAAALESDDYQDSGQAVKEKAACKPTLILLLHLLLRLSISYIDKINIRYRGIKVRIKSLSRLPN